MNSLLALDRGEIQVSLSQLKNSDGPIYIALFKAQTGIVELSKSNKPFMKRKLEIRNNKAYVSFKNIPLGSYALLAFHDQNMNKDLDLNFLGKPLEGIAFSNDFKIKKTPPKFKDISFKLNKKVLRLNLLFNYH